MDPVSVDFDYPDCRYAYYEVNGQRMKFAIRNPPPNCIADPKLQCLRLQPDANDPYGEFIACPPRSQSPVAVATAPPPSGNPVAVDFEYPDCNFAYYDVNGQRTKFAIRNPPPNCIADPKLQCLMLQPGPQPYGEFIACPPRSQSPVAVPTAPPPSGNPIPVDFDFPDCRFAYYDVNGQRTKFAIRNPPPNCIPDPKLQCLRLQPDPTQPYGEFIACPPRPAAPAALPVVIKKAATSPPVAVMVAPAPAPVMVAPAPAPMVVAPVDSSDPSFAMATVNAQGWMW